MAWEIHLGKKPFCPSFERVTGTPKNRSTLYYLCKCRPRGGAPTPLHITHITHTTHTHTHTHTTQYTIHGTPYITRHTALADKSEGWAGGRGQGAGRGGEGEGERGGGKERGKRKGVHLDTLLLHLLHLRTSGHRLEFREALRDRMDVSCVENVVIRDPIFTKVNKHEGILLPGANIDLRRLGGSFRSSRPRPPKTPQPSRNHS